MNTLKHKSQYLFLRKKIQVITLINSLMFSENCEWVCKRKKLLKFPVIAFQKGLISYEIMFLDQKYCFSYVWHQK